MTKFANDSQNFLLLKSLSSYWLGRFSMDGAICYQFCIHSYFISLYFVLLEFLDPRSRKQVCQYQYFARVGVVVIPVHHINIISP